MVSYLCSTSICWVHLCYYLWYSEISGSNFLCEFLPTVWDSYQVSFRALVSNGFIVIILGQYTFLCLQAFCWCVFVFILFIVCLHAFIQKSWGCFWKPFLVHSLDMKQNKLSQWDMTRYTVFFHCMRPLLGKSYVTAPHLHPAFKHKQYSCFRTVT